MSELQQHYDECCRTSTWAHPDPEECGCRGRGWLLSQVDTYHKCCYHEGRHPEDDRTDEEFEADNLRFAVFCMTEFFASCHKPPVAPAWPIADDDDIPF